MTEELEHSESSEASDATERQRPAPRWNIVSVAAPLTGVFLAFIVLLAGIPGDSEWGWGTLWVAILIVTGSVAVGLSSVVVAYRRSERKPGLTALGFMINALPVLTILGLMILGD